MRLYDLHTHTTMSDADYPLEELVETERVMGRGLGVSDHIFCSKIFTERDLAAYIEALRPYSVYRGVEANIGQDFSLPESLDDDIDYVIASVHSMPDGRGGQIPLGPYFCKRAGEPYHYERNYSPDLCRMYLAQTIKLIEHTFSTQRVDILGHATVIPCCEDLFGTKFLLDWENAVLGLCRRYGVALEIASFWHAPDIEMLKRAKAIGLRFSMGSDCHHRRDIGVLDYGERVMETLHLGEDDFFMPRRTLEESF